MSFSGVKYDWCNYKGHFTACRKKVRMVKCPKCDGRGGGGWTNKCPQCNGTGYVCEHGTNDPYHYWWK